MDLARADARVKTGSLVTLALALTMAACSDLPPGPGDPPGYAPPPEAGQPSFANGGDCPSTSDPALPSGAGCVSTVFASNDVLTVYAVLNKKSRPSYWRIRLDSEGSRIDQPLDAGNAYSYPRAVGAADVDGDGAPEWWVKTVDYTSHGAPWSGLHLFFAGGRKLFPLEMGGGPLAINYGGIARLGEGAKCRRGRLILLRAEAENVRNTRWKVSQRTYRMDGTEAVLVDRVEEVLVISDYNDPDLDPYYRVDCNGFVFPS